MSGFLEGHLNAKEAELNLRFGLRISVCDDLNEKNEEEIKKTYYETPTAYRSHFKAAEDDTEFNKQLKDEVAQLTEKKTSKKDIDNYISTRKSQRNREKYDLTKKAFNEKAMWEKEQVKLYSAPHNATKIYKDLAEDMFDVAYYLADDEFRALTGGLPGSEIIWGPLYGVGLSQEIIDKNKPEIVSVFRIDDKMDSNTLKSKQIDIDTLIQSLRNESVGTAGGLRKSLKNAIKELKQLKTTLNKLSQKTVNEEKVESESNREKINSFFELTKKYNPLESLIPTTSKSIIPTTDKK